VTATELFVAEFIITISVMVVPFEVVVGGCGHCNAQIRSARGSWSVSAEISVGEFLRRHVRKVVGGQLPRQTLVVVPLNLGDIGPENGSSHDVPVHASAHSGAANAPYAHMFPTCSPRSDSKKSSAQYWVTHSSVDEYRLPCETRHAWNDDSAGEQMARSSSALSCHRIVGGGVI
jgi:hypothetical protein